MAEWYEAFPEVDAAPVAAAPVAAAPVALAAPAPAASPVTEPVAAATPEPIASTAPAAAAPATGGNWWDAFPEVNAAAPAQPAAPAAPAAAPTSAMDQIGHQLGLTARAGVQGALALPGMVSDAVTGPINAGLDAVAGEGNGFRFQKASTAASNLMDAAGVAQPQNATERVVQDMATGAASAAIGVGAGAAIAKAAGPLTRVLGASLAANPGMQVASGATGAGAAGVTRENGGGALAQGVAGIAGALAPSAVPFAAQAGIRGVVRGGEAGRQTMVDNIQTFQDAAGTVPTLGQATAARSMQGAETGLTNVVGSSGIMMRAGQRQADALAHSVQDLTDSLAPGANGADAGEAITRGVNAFKAAFKTTQEHLYNKLDAYLPSGTPIGVSNTQQALADLNAGIPGAPNISKFFRNGRISSIDQAMVDDLAQAGSGGTLPYEALKKLRTLVGGEISDNSLMSDVPRSKWSALYGALSQDLGGAATAAGPQAEQAWARANTYTRLNLERMEQLSGIVNRDAPEKIFKAATTGLAEGGTQINRLMKSLPIDNRKEVAAAVLNRMGRAKPGQQNEMGDKFSSETFLSTLGAMSPQARRALFGSLGVSGLEMKIGQMGRMASSVREGSKVFANPSGTARQGAMIGWAAGLGTALATGNSAAIFTALGAPVLASGLARVTTSPTVVKAFAKSTKMNAAAGAIATEAVGNASTPDASAAPKVYTNRMQAGQQARQQGGTVVAAPSGGFLVQPGTPRRTLADAQRERGAKP